MVTGDRGVVKGKRGVVKGEREVITGEGGVVTGDEGREERRIEERGTSGYIGSLILNENNILI